MTNLNLNFGYHNANINLETGIRYGLLGMGNEHLADWVAGELEFLEIDPVCPECGETFENFESNDDSDYVCPHCGYESDNLMDSDEFYPENSPMGITSDGYKAELSENNELWIFESKYYTYADLCSPCAPNAGDLDSADEDTGTFKTYCLGHEFFESGTAPYPVYKVDTDERIQTEEEENFHHFHVCDDCLLGIVNGDFSGIDYHYSGEEAEKRYNHVVKSINKMPPNITTGNNGDNDENYGTCDCCGEKETKLNHMVAEKDDEYYKEWLNKQG